MRKHVEDPESLSRVMSISIQLSVTNSFKTQTVEDPESLSRVMSISIQLSVTNSLLYTN
jgi:flagellar basal body-associated protein FliL